MKALLAVGFTLALAFASAAHAQPSGLTTGADLQAESDALSSLIDVGAASANSLGSKGAVKDTYAFCGYIKDAVHKGACVRKLVPQWLAPLRAQAYDSSYYLRVQRIRNEVKSSGMKLEELGTSTKELHQLYAKHLAYDVRERINADRLGYLSQNLDFVRAILEKCGFSPADLGTTDEQLDAIEAILDEKYFPPT